jgi:hypothetical protein
MWPVASKVFSILVTKGAVVWSSPLFVCGVIVNQNPVFDVLLLICTCTTERKGLRGDVHKLV